MVYHTERMLRGNPAASIGGLFPKILTPYLHFSVAVSVCETHSLDTPMSWPVWLHIMAEKGGHKCGKHLYRSG